MSDRGFGQDAVSEIEDMRPIREPLKDLVDPPLHLRSAGEQPDRIEI
eukprot:gene18501-25200_t